jgi:hypothetical protein
VARILVHALIRIDADRSGARQLEGSPRLHPALDEVPHQPFSQLQLQHFPEPALGNVEREERACNDRKDLELVGELAGIVPRERIVEGLVPAIEPHLAVCGRHDHRGGGAREHEDGVAQGRGPQRPDHHVELHRQGRLRRDCDLGVLRRGRPRLPRKVRGPEGLRCAVHRFVSILSHARWLPSCRSGAPRSAQLRM